MLSTRVGYTGGDAPSPSYGSVCAGDGHTEALKIEFDPSVVSYRSLLDVLLAQHDPCVSFTTQYQSAVWPTTEAQKNAVMDALDAYEAKRGRAAMTTVAPPKAWHDAEWYHQRYNAKNKIRLALFAGVFACNALPHGSFPGQEQLKTVLGGLVFLSLLPQLFAPIDNVLSKFD